MIRAAARKILRSALQTLPVSVRDRLLVHLLSAASEPAKFQIGLPTVAGLLENLKRNGFSPKTIVDVGAYVGDWSQMACSIFPSAKVLMIDGNPKNEPLLQRAQRRIGPASEYSILLLGPEVKREVTFYVLGAGSSVLEELTAFTRTEVGLPMGTLDGLLETRVIATPTLLKLDVQGFEIEVLRGGTRTLASAEVVILETALLPYNRGAPLIPDVVGFMLSAGFAVYDFCGQARRQTDHALFQTDVAFVKLGSALRAPRKFWLHER